MAYQTSSRKSIIFFDGYCGLCHGFVQFLQKRVQDDRFQYAPLQGVTAKSEIPEMTDLDTLVYLTSDGVFVKSKAVFEILKKVSQPWRSLRVFRILPTFVTDLAYDIVARLRRKIAGTCDLPNPKDTRYLP